jgi:predicted dehydrogenase
VSLGIAVIGAGAWGLNHVRAVESSSSCRLVAVVDPSAAARAGARTIAPRAAVYEAAPPALVDLDVDAVIIAAPAPLHAELARAALARGKHVLVEKPLAMSLADAERVAAAAASADRTFMIGHLMVYHPAVVRLRELVRAGVLGELRYFHATRANLGRQRRDENALWSFGPHELSMLDFLLERAPISVAAHGACFLQPGVEDVVFLTRRYAGGELAHLHLSWLHPRKQRLLTVVGTAKMVEFDDVSPEKLRIFDKGYDRPPEFTEFAQYLTLRDGDVHIPQLPMAEPLRVQLEHFVECVETGRTPRTDLASGLRVVRVLEAAQRSLQSGGAPVDLRA